MFKLFGKEKKGKKEKENSQPLELTPEERKEAEKLPFGGNTRLSKSKSGRYKVKNKQRGALDSDIYATSGSVAGGATSSSSPSRAGATGSTSVSGRPTGAQSSSYVSSNAQASSSTNSASFGSQQQGSLGRTSGGHCGVATSVTKRYSGANTSISSQPTAV